MYKLFMAFRYLRAHKILYFSITGVAFGLTALVVVTSVMGGFSRDMKVKIRGMAAHFTVSPYSSQLWIADYDALCLEIEKVKHVKGCAPRVEWAAWLGRQGNFDDVQIVGMVPDQERKISQLPAYFEEGGKRSFDFRQEGGFPLANPGIVVGSQLINRTSPRVGLLTARYESGPLLCQRDFEVVGAFHSGMATYDSKYVFMELAAAQEFLKVGGNPDLNARPRVNVLAIAVDDYEKNGEKVREGIIDAIHRLDPCDAPETHQSVWGGGRCKHKRVRSWEQTNATLLAAVEVEKVMIVIMMMMIVLVAGFNIISINTLVVRAKTRDIGILRALGATEGGVIGIFLSVGMLCGLFGSIFGIGLGLLLSWKLNAVCDLIRILTRDLNRVGHASAGAWPVWLSAGSLIAAAVAVIATWVVLYRDRPRTPWVRIIAAGVFLGLAAWASTTWMPDYVKSHRYDFDMPGRWRVVAWVVAFWVLLMAAWRSLDRWRRRPAWVFFGAAATVAMSFLMLAVVGMSVMTVSLALKAPRPGWRGLSPFPDDIYYLDRIPVFVDSTTLSVIVALTLLISLIFSIYPAIRASRANPIEAIRDE